MSTGVLELKERRGKLFGDAQAMLDKADAEKRNFRADEQKSFESMTKEIERLKTEIDNREFIEREERELALTTRHERPPESWGRREGADKPGRPAASEFVDVRTGKPLPVFDKDRGLSEHYRVPAGFRFGRVLLAKATNQTRFLTDAERRAMEGQSDHLGGFTQATIMGASVIDLARSKSVAIQAGAKIVPMEGAELLLAKIDTDPTIDWVAENVQQAETGPVFGSIVLHARTARAYIPISAELAADSANALEALEMAASGAIGLALDKAVLFGGTTGNANEPIGLRRMDNVNEITAVGSPSDYSKFSDGVYQCRLNNAPGQLSVISHPRLFNSLDKLEDSTGQPLAPLPSWVEAKKFDTTSISIVEGGGANESSAIVGPMDQVLIGVRLEATLIEGPIEATKYQRQFVVVLRAAVAVPRPRMFTRLLGILA